MLSSPTLQVLHKINHSKIVEMPIFSSSMSSSFPWYSSVSERAGDDAAQAYKAWVNSSSISHFAFRLPYIPRKFCHYLRCQWVAAHCHPYHPSLPWWYGSIFVNYPLPQSPTYNLYLKHNIYCQIRPYQNMASPLPQYAHHKLSSVLKILPIPWNSNFKRHIHHIYRNYYIRKIEHS